MVANWDGSLVGEKEEKAKDVCVNIVAQGIDSPSLVTSLQERADAYEQKQKVDTNVLDIKRLGLEYTRH